MEKIYLSLIGAILIGLSTYVTKMQKGEKFEPLKLLRTVLVGLSVGISTNILNIPPETGADSAIIFGTASAGITALGDQGVKFIINLVKKFINKKI